jgi:hypothetical protein
MNRITTVNKAVSVCVFSVLLPPAACDGVGVGSLQGAISINASNIESFRNCTKINGGVPLNAITFSG